MSLILERVLVTASRTLARLRMLQEQRVAMSLILGIIKLRLVEVIDLLNGRALELLLLQLRLRLMEYRRLRPPLRSLLRLKRRLSRERAFPISADVSFFCVLASDFLRLSSDPRDSDLDLDLDLDLEYEAILLWRRGGGEHEARYKGEAGSGSPVRAAGSCQDGRLRRNTGRPVAPRIAPAEGGPVAQ